MVHGNGEDDFERLASNDLLRHYKMEVVFYPVFFHNQETVRYNILTESGRRLQPKQFRLSLELIR